MNDYGQFGERGYDCTDEARRSIRLLETLIELYIIAAYVPQKGDTDIFTVDGVTSIPSKGTITQIEIHNELAHKDLGHLKKRVERFSRHVEREAKAIVGDYLPKIGRYGKVIEEEPDDT